MSECFRQKYVQEQSYYIDNNKAFLTKIKDRLLGRNIKIFGKKKSCFRDFGTFSNVLNEGF